MKPATLPHLLIAASLAIRASQGFGQNQVQQNAGATAVSKNGPECRASGRDQITIACNYPSKRGSESVGKVQPAIVLTRALLSFQPTDESNMRVELTFKNVGSAPISDTRTAYLSVDDAKRNYVRRVLPHVDFRKLAPGQSLTFSELLLVGAFRAGNYTVHLWIPSSDETLKFDPSKNLLLGNKGVADPDTGLNTLATFTVTR